MKESEADMSFKFNINGITVKKTTAGEKQIIYTSIYNIMFNIKKITLEQTN